MYIGLADLICELPLHHTAFEAFIQIQIEQDKRDDPLLSVNYVQPATIFMKNDRSDPLLKFSVVSLRVAYCI